MNEPGAYFSVSADGLLYGFQPPEEHIPDGRILKPRRPDLGDLVQAHGADGLQGSLTLGELPAARLTAGAVDCVIGQEGLVA